MMLQENGSSVPKQHRVLVGSRAEGLCPLPPCHAHCLVHPSHPGLLNELNNIPIAFVFLKSLEYLAMLDPTAANNVVLLLWVPSGSYACRSAAKCRVVAFFVSSTLAIYRPYKVGVLFSFTRLLHDSFIPRTSIEWNHLPTSAATINNLSMFKLAIDNLFFVFNDTYLFYLYSLIIPLALYCYPLF